ncbi:MAG: 2OG-Fe(II) oxygenase family protein [Caulobacter sp.]|nr:2OG-Fe(II) oxygenase family protein [Caulobacter sp.]
MSGLVLRLNPALDPAAFREAYDRDGHVQIANVFEPDVIEGLAQILDRSTPWDLAVSTPAGREEVFTQGQLAAMSREAIAGKIQGAARRAGEGFAFVYLCYPMIAAYLAGRDPGHPLHQLTEFLNGPEFLAFGSAVSGAAGITKVDAQASYYRPGDFLSLHDDTGPTDERRVAYTLGFTRRWRPDWGGQLLFHDAAGDIVRGLAPGFNVLTLFKVPRWHSVAPVAPYAAGKRLQVVGWLRDDPVAGAPR